MIFDLGIGQISAEIDCELLIVMPIYNEEANIDQLLKEWIPVLEAEVSSFCILALNDGSRDGTAQILARNEQTYGSKLCVVNKPNTGHGLSCRMGYDIAVNSSVQWVLQIDSDGQCNPEYFKEFWAKRQNADCVFGQRTTRGDGTARLITSRICSLGSSLVCGRKMGDANVPYRLMRREVLQQALPYIPADFNIHNVALTYVLKRMDKVRWETVEIHFRNRQGGTNSINLFRVSKWGLEMLVELLSIKHPQ